MKKVLIIGFGASGIAATKAALDNDLKPVVFEKNSDQGGVWNSSMGASWRNMQANLSKFSCMFSDFPWPSDIEATTFPSQQQVRAYLDAYINEFNLTDYIQFNTTVTNVKLMTHNDKHAWIVNYQHADGAVETDIFDAVVVATGIFSKPKFPEKFVTNDASIIHANSYQSREAFAGKRVIIVGGAFTGCEIAADVSQVAQSVTHIVSTRHWVLPRYINGKPLDFAFYKRSSRDKTLDASAEESNQRKNGYFNQICQQQVNLGIAPNAAPETPVFVAISDGYLQAVTEQKIHVIVDAKAVNAWQGIAILRDKDQVLSALEADIIICCTGYTTELGFLSESLRGTLEVHADEQFQPLILHKATLHPECPNMAFVGMNRGPYFGVMELQARWAAALISGKVAPPSINEMEQGLAASRAIRDADPRSQFPHGDYIGFCDDLAKQINAYPDFENIKDKDPDLYRLLYDNPMFPPHYRLFGLNAKPQLAMSSLKELDLLINKGVYKKASSFSLSQSMSAHGMHGITTQLAPEASTMNIATLGMKGSL